MVERKNRDLKPRLAILVGDDHTSWADKLPTIRFAMNTAWCQSTGQTAAYLNFGREMRTLDDVTHDLRPIVEAENFVPQITPYLQMVTSTWQDARSINEKQQYRQKTYSDTHKRDVAPYALGDRVWITTHTLSKTDKGITSKFHPKRDGPYEVIRIVSPVSYQVANPADPFTPLGIYHSSALTPVQGNPPEEPVVAIRRRGRPPKKHKEPASGSSSGRVQNHRGRV
ncbi:uncharacterized protein LOC111692953 [Anoplophora glabripennis]|uniref:uncharacterized protein LOC111692953 n=1 Tax=Anoplophora glabripennis TaxID=217634 RepID=UPI000C767FFF|nr:uncharacterized protein LOC111692953 [Anoplophora glabripennis]